MKITWKNFQDPRERKQQAFDREVIHIIKCGQKINVYDSIQAASEDTDIYETLEKYGSIESMQKYNGEEIKQDFDDYMSLQDLQERTNKANNMWEKLPAGVREKFHNNIFEFLQKAPKWLDEEANKIKNAIKTPTTPQPTEPQPTEPQPADTKKEEK